MKKFKPSLEIYAIVAGFALVSLLQLIHAVLGLSNIKNTSATEQVQKTVKDVAKPHLIMPGATIQLAGGR